MHSLPLVQRLRLKRSLLLARNLQFMRSLRKQPIPPEGEHQARGSVRSCMQLVLSRATFSFNMRSAALRLDQTATK